MIFSRQKVFGAKIYFFSMSSLLEREDSIVIIVQAAGPAAHQEDNPD